MRSSSIGLIAIVLSLTIMSTGFFQFASAFVNIVSPERGEAVPAGSSLTVSGTSDDNTQFNCKIQIIVNDHRPYQDTIPVCTMFWVDLFLLAIFASRNSLSLSESELIAMGKIG